MDAPFTTRTPEDARTLRRAMDILMAFTPERNELTVTDLSKATGLSRATVYRLLMTLVSGGFLDRDSDTLRYKVGPGLFIVGSMYLDSNNVMKAASSVVSAVNRLSGEATNFAVYHDGYITLTMREEAVYGYRWPRRVGTTLAAHSCAIGLAILSELDDVEIDLLYPQESLPKFTPKTISTKAELWSRLATVRERHLSIDEGATEGVRGYAVAIKARSGRVVGGFSITVPRFRLNPDYCNKLESLALNAAAVIAYRLGSYVPDGSVSTVEELSRWWKATVSDKDDVTES
jgi:DNA-binding IclR family transcriptional regulator